MRVAVQCAYDGRRFHGFARQPQLRTVEGDLILALIQNGFIEDTKQSNFRAASRTDKGVSALGNMISFDTERSPHRIYEALQQGLQDIVIFGVFPVDDDFFPRYARMRWYRYYLPVGNLDVDKVVSTAAVFAGEHNFSNFARMQEFKDPVRSIDNIVITHADAFVLFDFFAQTFLWQQIRRIVAAIQKVATGKLEKDEVVQALHNIEQTVDFGVAKPEYLLLMNVFYDRVFDESDEVQELRDQFEYELISSFS